MPEDFPPSRLLLVEGMDDEHVVRHICRHQSDMPEFSIRHTSGFTRLKDAICPEIKVSARTALGILADANDNLKARWQAIGHKLRQAAFNPPTSATPGGTIVEGRPRVGLWLMPDNMSTGELEDFIQKLIPVGDPVWPRAKHYIDGIPEGDRKFKPGKILRAEIHAWLATRKEPRRMGTAIRAGDLNVSDPLVMQFLDWLRQLFG